MNVNVLQENLAAGIATVKRAVAKRSTLPILSNILLTAEKGALSLSATNLEIGIVTHVPAQVNAEGAITIPASQLADYVNALPPDRVELALNPKTSTVHLKCARNDANLKGVDASEFPIIPVAQNQDDRAAIDADNLRALIARSVFSAASDVSRPVLECALADFSKTQVQFVTADGFRLSVACVQLERAFGAPLNKALIPAKALSDLAALLKAQEEPVFIAFGPNNAQIIFELADTVLVTNLQDGNFPDFNQIVPKSHSTRVILNASELQEAVKRQTVFAREAFNIVRLNISSGNDMSGGKVTIEAQSAESGDGVSEIDAQVETYNEKPLDVIAFNARFLNEAVTACGSPQIALELNDAASPGVIRPVGRDDFTHVIMPMHLDRMRTPIR
jgi:DNA polymerase-3 subunit beta